MSLVANLLSINILGVEVSGWSKVAGIFLASYLTMWLFKVIVVGWLRKLSEKTTNRIDDAVFRSLDTIGWPLYLSVSLFVASNFVTLPGLLAKIINVVTLAITIFYAVKVLQSAIAAFTKNYITGQGKEGSKRDPTVLHFASRFVSYSLWFFAALLILENAGFDINSVIAGLGVAGIAVALAVQNILGDVFSSLSIYFDKPFKVGDFIIVGEDMGTVVKIGIKTTRIDALQGEEIIISNKELTQSRIHNFGKMSKRRVQFNFGITYETPTEKIGKVNEFVKKSVEKVEGATLDRSHFKEFGDSSLVYEVVYYVPTGDYNKYMDAQQTINQSLIEFFQKNGLEFAYPTHKIYLSK